MGWTKVSGKVDWKMLDEAVCQVFKVGAWRILSREPLEIFRHCSTRRSIPWLRSSPALFELLSASPGALTVLFHIGLYYQDGSCIHAGAQH